MEERKEIKNKFIPSYYPPSIASIPSYYPPSIASIPSYYPPIESLLVESPVIDYPPIESLSVESPVIDYPTIGPFKKGKNKPVLKKNPENLKKKR